MAQCRAFISKKVSSLNFERIRKAFVKLELDHSRDRNFRTNPLCQPFFTAFIICENWRPYYCCDSVHVCIELERFWNLVNESLEYGCDQCLASQSRMLLRSNILGGIELHARRDEKISNLYVESRMCVGQARSFDVWLVDVDNPAFVTWNSTIWVLFLILSLAYTCSRPSTATVSASTENCCTKGTLNAWLRFCDVKIRSYWEAHIVFMASLSK